MEEDTQPITEPMISPITTKVYDILEKKIPDTMFEFDFLAGLMTKPELIRNVIFYKLDCNKWYFTPWENIIYRFIGSRNP